MQKCLVIGKVWPEPASSAAGTRMIQLLQCLQKNGLRVIFGSASSVSEHASPLADMGIATTNILLNDPAFDRIVADLDPDLVIFDRFTTEEQFGWRVALHCPRAVRILDTEDLHGLRAARETAVKENRDFTESDLYNDISRREVASIYRCDLSLIISKSEMDVLTSKFRVPPEMLIELPFLYPKLTEADIAAWQPYRERTDFIFAGNFLHAPNRDAVHYLREKIWPGIRRLLPKAQINIYGAYTGDAERALHDPGSGFRICGRAGTIESVMSHATVSLAPLRFGAGQKGKIADSFRCGTPCITTRTGADGMGDADSWPGAVADNENEFAQRAAELCRSEERWNQASAACLTRFNLLFDGELDGRRFVQKITRLALKLDQHRRANFTGSVLLHQTVHATRWLAKYIELKNAAQADKPD